MHPKLDFDRLYTDISASVASTIADISKLEVEHEDGKQRIGDMLGKLRSIQARFDDQLTDLQTHAEWDKFTLAFFGETNAGKSTIIESMRILFDEESRQQLLRENGQDVARYEEALETHVRAVQEGLAATYKEYADQIAAIKRDAAALAVVVREESSDRTRRKNWGYALAGMVIGIVVAVPATLLASGLL
ncbi:hypothetical protein [Achromobacter aloeverae]|nr:hypothetical protein [Achromobacter aloeverae]